MILLLHVAAVAAAGQPSITADGTRILFNAAGGVVFEMDGVEGGSIDLASMSVFLKTTNFSRDSRFERQRARYSCAYISRSENCDACARRRCQGGGEPHHHLYHSST